jgi:pantothenate kinase-related protein Tda10
MDKQEAYRIVYEDLHSIPLLRGEDIDTRQAGYWWLRGMQNVMERIAEGVSYETKKAFQEEYHRNLEASRMKYESRKEPIHSPCEPGSATDKLNAEGPIGPDDRF